MRGRSHICLGRYLVYHYMDGVSKLHIHAFLLGCIEPDRNPATYLKGSIRHQWLRGHNYPNARRFMTRIAYRLERKLNWNALDYYTLGKLIHYTTDAFTYAHNDMFTHNLDEHQKYEIALQEHFLNYMRQNPQINQLHNLSIMDSIRRYHREYKNYPASVHTDSHFALAACSYVINYLFLDPIRI